MAIAADSAHAALATSVEGGWFDRLPPMSELEQEMVALACDPQPNSRLACQIKIDDGLEGLIVWTPVRQ